MTHTKPTVSGMKVTFTLNKNTVMSICGVAISSNFQEVDVMVLEDGKRIEGINSVKFDDDLQGQGEIMEFVPTEHYVAVYGPFDKERKLELLFSHGGSDSDYNEKILTDKVKSLTDEDGTTRVDMIPYDNGYTEGKEVTDCIVTVVRWSK